MSQQTRIPTSLKRLRELVVMYDSRDDGLDQDTTECNSWLRWTLNHLESRDLYHKKQRIKNKLLVEAAKQLLDPDELTTINTKAEEELE